VLEKVSTEHPSAEDQKFKQVQHKSKQELLRDDNLQLLHVLNTSKFAEEFDDWSQVPTRLRFREVVSMHKFSQKKMEDGKKMEKNAKKMKAQNKKMQKSGNKKAKLIEEEENTEDTK